MISWAIGGSALFLGWILARRILKIKNFLLSLGLSPLLGATFLIAAARVLPHHQRAIIAIVFVSLGLLGLLVTTEEDPVSPPPLSKPQKTVLFLITLIVVSFTYYYQLRFIDTDNWIHEPLIASYTKDIFPPHNPYMPETIMNGHYGRDLLIAILTQEGTDPLLPTWIINLVLQTASLITLFSALRRQSLSNTQALTGTIIPFFGICTGIRTGLIDTFDGNNGVAYALLILNLFLIIELLQGRSAIGHWLVTGISLGLYQLVYETHFGLLLLTGLTAAIFYLRPARHWIGLTLIITISLTLACTEGGPLTDLAYRYISKQNTSSTHISASIQNRSQHVTIRFPKKHLFQVLVTTADYQRLSAAYLFAFFHNLRPTITDRGYINIFSRSFLAMHWLPVLLAPLTLFVLCYFKHLTGITYWILGAWAYIIPGLVDFGPVYELEYFRWEFAAGFAFATALGIATASIIERSPSMIKPSTSTSHSKLWYIVITKNSLLKLLSILVVLLCVLPAERILNNAIIDCQKGRVYWTTNPGLWRVKQKDYGISQCDLKATAWLAPQVMPKERFLSNLVTDTPSGIWPDAIISARTGALPAGHSQPPIGSMVHAHPFYHRSPIAKAFYITGNPRLLQGAGISWLYLDLHKMSPSALNHLNANRSILRPSPLFSDDTGETRQIFNIAPPNDDLISQPPFASMVTLAVPNAELRTHTRYPITIMIKNKTDSPRRLGWIKSQVIGNDKKEVIKYEPLLILGGQQPFPPGTGDIIEHSMVTPMEEGDFTLEVSLPQTESGAPFILGRIPFKVDFHQRLQAIHAELKLPNRLLPHRFYRIHLTLLSRVPIKSTEELDLYWRLKTIIGYDTPGDYLWELDRILQPIDLDLHPQQEQAYTMTLLTPNIEGRYLMELYFYDRKTETSIKIGNFSQPIEVYSTVHSRIPGR